jgi:hypothetical protein
MMSQLPLNAELFYYTRLLSQISAYNCFFPNPYTMLHTVKFTFFSFKAKYENKNKIRS